MRNAKLLSLILLIFTFVWVTACDSEDKPNGTETDGTDTGDTETEDTETEDTGTEDTGTEDTGTEDTGIEDTDTNTGTEDTETEDTETETVEPDPVVTHERAQEFMANAVGRYAHYDIVAYVSDLPPMGEFRNLIISYGYTEFELVDDELIVTDRFCFSQQDTNQPFKSSFSDEATQAIIPDSVSMQIRENKDGVLYLWRPETPTLLGIDYDDPYTTPLPKTIEENDPRIVDADEDGKPGVTVNIDMGEAFDNAQEEMYIARREIFAFEAYLKENGNYEGTVHDRSEQLIIGASSPLLTMTTQEFVQYEDLTASPIMLVPVADNFGCEELAAQRDELFPPNPPVW